jgi:hypothetical protein
MRSDNSARSRFSAPESIPSERPARSRTGAETVTWTPCSASAAVGREIVVRSDRLVGDRVGAGTAQVGRTRRGVDNVRGRRQVSNVLEPGGGKRRIAQRAPDARRVVRRGRADPRRGALEARDVAFQPGTEPGRDRRSDSVLPLLQQAESAGFDLAVASHADGRERRDDERAGQERSLDTEGQLHPGDCGSPGPVSIDRTAPSSPVFSRADGGGTAAGARPIVARSDRCRSRSCRRSVDAHRPAVVELVFGLAGRLPEAVGSPIVSRRARCS